GKEHVHRYSSDDFSIDIHRIPYGKAQCEGVPSNSTSPDICRSSDVDFVCTTVCASKGYISGECDNNFVCNCYNCLA
ncbi:unnamed protein product, partial [Brassica oleracea var. botrytis]